MTTEYILRYCYRYEPSFDVYSIWDLVLYRESDDVSMEVFEYLKKEDEQIDKEDEYQIFFRVKHFVYREDAKEIPFLKLELFPKKHKDDSVLNLVYINLDKDWKSYSNLEQLIIIDEEIKNQEKFVDFKYKLVNYSIDTIELEYSSSDFNGFEEADELEE